jgi:outer membrane protein assembly factor BamA
MRPFLKKETFIKNLGFVTFLDYGNVWDKMKSFKFNEIALAFGGGIRYYSMIGAIRLDIGFKLYDPNPGPVGGAKWIFQKGAHFGDKYTIQFGIGNTF